MKSRYIERPLQFDDNEIKLISQKYGFDGSTDFLLKKYCPTVNEAESCFSDGEDGLLDVSLMPYIDAAVEKINAAKQQDKKILIFGDYDADGISAAAILKLFFDTQDIDSFVYLPKRSEGYGLKIETLLDLHRREKFDLLLTVDCGITAVDEVEFVKKILRADVVITDHHEPGERLPSCVCVNPKLGYPFRDLSGSGVALKLVQALSSVETAKYFCDLASIGTIADIMPMASENRAIVKIGCRNINNLGLKTLLQVNKMNLKQVDCSSMAMKVCPKINAAGRVDEPGTALELLLATSVAEAEGKVKKLIEANAERQRLTEESFAEALEYIDKNNLSSLPAIFVYGEHWKHGILGLIANKLVERFQVPVGAFMPDGDNIIGSLRTPEGVNLHAVVSKLKQYLLRFGGHKMSVGITVFKDCFKSFYQKFIELVGEEKPQSAERYYDAVFCPNYLGEAFLNTMKSFEPILPNNKVVFYGEFSVKSVSLFGKNKNFVKILTADNLELKTFADCSNIVAALRTNCNFECVFSLEYDDFAGKYVGNMSDINLLNSISFDDIYLRNYIDKISFEAKEGEDAEYIPLNQVGAFADEGSCCCVFGSMLEFERFAEKADFSDFYLNFFFPRQSGNTVLISPDKNVDFGKFDSVIFFNRYSPDIEGLCRQENVYYCSDGAEIPSYIKGQKVDRDACVRVFKAVLANMDNCTDSYELYLKSGVFEYAYGTFLYILKIFEELKIFEVREKPFCILYNKGVKVDLSSSRLFNMIATD